MSDCIIECAFLGCEPENGNFKRVWLNFKAPKEVKLTVKHTLQKGMSPETAVLNLIPDKTEYSFIIPADSKEIKLFITDVTTQKSWRIIVPLYKGSIVSYN